MLLFAHTREKYRVQRAIRATALHDFAATPAKGLEWVRSTMPIPGGPVKSRLAASLIISVAVITGATGCSMISPVATKIDYSPSDGVNVPDSGTILVRNAFIVATEDGSNGNLIAAFINESDKNDSVSIEVDGLSPLLVKVPVGEPVSLGANTDPLLIEGLDAMPGSTVAVYFQSGAAEGELVQVPVLDGSLSYYAEFVPTTK